LLSAVVKVALEPLTFLLPSLQYPNPRLLQLLQPSFELDLQTLILKGNTSDRGHCLDELPFLFELGIK
jgi:hypothetical protein